MMSSSFEISYPPVLPCSQFVIKEFRKRNTVQMELDILPSVHHDALYRQLIAYTEAHPKRSIKNMLKDTVDAPERYLLFLLTKHNIDEGMNIANVSKDLIHHLVTDIKYFTFHVDGSLSIEKAFVTGGGVRTKEIIPNT